MGVSEIERQHSESSTVSIPEGFWVMISLREARPCASHKVTFIIATYALLQSRRRVTRRGARSIWLRCDQRLSLAIFITSSTSSSQRLGCCYIIAMAGPLSKEVPLHVVENANVETSQLLESSRRQVQVELAAPGAAVDNGDRYGLALDCITRVS